MQSRFGRVSRDFSLKRKAEVDIPLILFDVSPLPKCILPFFFLFLNLVFAIKHSPGVLFIFIMFLVVSFSFYKCKAKKPQKTFVLVVVNYFYFIGIKLFKNSPVHCKCTYDFAVSLSRNK